MVRRGEPIGWRSGIGVLVGVLWLGAATPLAAQEAPHPLELTGFQPGRGYLSLLPWEAIDVFSGSVVLTAVDLVLPGNAGLDLTVTRVFNSKGSWRWRIGIGPTVFDPPEPVPNPWGFWSNPEIWQVDGSEQPTFETSTGSGVFLTTGYARYTRSTRTLQEPDGTVYLFEESGEPGYLRLRQIADAFGNTIDVYYDGWRMRAVQHLGGQQDREVSLLLDALGRVTTVSYSPDGLCEAGPGQPIAGRDCLRWVYGWGESGDARTLTVTPPQGPGWVIASTSAGGAGTLTVTTPQGGRVAYDVGVFPRPPRKREGVAYTRMVTARRVADRGADYDPAAAWTFTYIGMGGGETLVTGPGRQLRYLSSETGATTSYLAREEVYRFNEFNQPVLAGTTDYTYRAFGTGASDPPQPLGLAPAWPDPWDPEIVRADPYPLLLSQVNRSRPVSTGGMRAYARAFRYCGQSGQPGCPAEPTNDAGRPRQLIESGDFERTTTLTYRHAFGGGVYRRGVPTSQAVTVGAETFATTDTHNDLGFLTARDQFGIVTAFAPSIAGNLASVTDARGSTTTLSHDWGVRKDTETPAYTISRSINPDGTVQAVTQNGATTTFEYDRLGRPTRVHPPLGADTVTTYAEDGTWVTVARGASWTRTDLDGFGRAVHTVNSQGVHTETGYDTLGRTTWVRAPWDSAHPENRTTAFTYDVWDRVTVTTNPDASAVHTSYTVDAAGLTTAITDENGHTTTQHWQATGSPDGGRLAGVTDAAGQLTGYAYDALGSLTQVTSPGGVVRTWVYNPKHQLASQTQPESGTVTYGYDAAGNLAWQTDAKDQTTTYGYDGNNRLIGVTVPAPLQAYSTTIGYDAANNRRTLVNGHVSTTFDYDEANRLTRRTDALNDRTFVSAYTLDDRGNVIDVQYPSGNHVAYGYDSENRVTSVSDPARGLMFASAITSHPAAGLTGYASGDGAAHAVSYDARQRPAQITATGVANLPGLTYSYDDVGNVTGIAEARPGHSALFTYDALDRLKTAGGAWGALEYWYDPLGNRTQQTHGSGTTTYTYLSQRLMSTGGAGAAAFTYDANGNLETEQSATFSALYSYTPANMLDTVALGAGAVYLYRYDGDHQRALKFQGSTKTTYYLRGLGQVLAEFEEEGGQLRWTLDQVYLGTQLLAAARPPAGTTVLTLGKAGAGTGTVTSSPSGIDCGPECSGTSEAFPAGTVVTLSAVPATGWVFVGWSGDLDCGDGVVTLTDPTTCVATFALTAPLFAKQSPLSGTGRGTRWVTLQWAAAPNAAYVVCWDTVNNGVCDTTWQANGVATKRVVEFPTNGTYYWQVKTYTGTEADDGVWWSLTVTAPPLFTKVSPGDGASGLGTVLTLQWTPVPNEGYWVCWDTSDNDTCDTMWWPSPIPTQAVSNLSAGTYYWQVKTAGSGIPADNGTWHHFTVAAPALYVKQSPGNGATGLGPTVTLQWSAVPDEGYYVCWDTTNNSACDGTWWPTGAGTARVLEGLTTGTYYWQVRTAGGAVLADNGAWHAFTVSTAALFTKHTPANGATGLGSTVTLAWTSVPDEGYYVCWDTSDNNTCDATWWPTAAGTSRVVEGLSAGTYYWQARTAGGAVLADDGTWHHFTVAGEPAAAVAWTPRGASSRPVRPQPAVIIVGAGLLGLLAVTSGVRRRWRVVVTGALLFVLAPATGLAQSTSQVIEYYTTDAIGSLRAVTKQVNGQWQVVARHDFMPFGEEVAPQVPPQDKRLFTGKERDAETGMDYFGARYYRASLGRFTTVDPELNVKEALVDPQRWNRYAYVRNSPLRYIDPDGRDVHIIGQRNVQQIERMSRESTKFRQEVAAARADKSIMVIVRDPTSQERAELTSEEPGAAKVSPAEGGKVVNIYIKVPDDDATMAHEWGHEKHVRENYDEFLANVKDPKEQAKSGHDDKKNEQKANDFRDDVQREQADARKKKK